MLVIGVRLNETLQLEWPGLELPILVRLDAIDAGVARLELQVGPSCSLTPSLATDGFCELKLGLRTCKFILVECRPARIRLGIDAPPDVRALRQAVSSPVAA